LFDEDFNDTAGRYELSSMPAIREAALIMYGRFIAHMYKREPDDDAAAKATQHLSLQETENIVREHASVDGELYAIGGDTAEEAKERINGLMFALMDRVMSNVIAEGVKQDLLDCNYDATKNDFAFSVTDKGKQIVENLRKARHDADRPDIPRDQEF
jgi:hypothetical protein